MTIPKAPIWKRTAGTWVTGAALVLAGCGSQADGGSKGDITAVTSSSGTVAMVLGSSAEYSSISEVLNETGVAGAFDGAGNYTILAPNNHALGALSDRHGNLLDEERRVLLIALLRAHILPGDITPASIREALAASGGPVQMRNLAGGLVTFTSNGDAIEVTGTGGERATLNSGTVMASNGVVIPLNESLAPMASGASADQS